MPKGPVTKDFVDLLQRPNPAVFACTRPDGSPSTCVVWFLWDEGRVQLTFDAGRKRLDFIRRNPAVSLCILDVNDMFRNISLNGHITELQDDPEFAGTDRLAKHYLGRTYPNRVKPRVSGWLEIESWFGWNAHAEVENLEGSWKPNASP